MMEKLVFLGLFLVAAFAISEATVCKSNTECGAGSCCYIQPEFLVASKKRQASILPIQVHMHHDTGVCEMYRAHGDPCGLFEVMNGHCGCGSGMSCQWVPDPTTPLPVLNHVLRRRPPVHNEPGVCEKYRVMDEHCAPLETMNGHCGCGSGMGCQWVPDPTMAPLTLPTLVAQVVSRRRSMIYHPEPGAYKCAVRV